MRWMVALSAGIAILIAPGLVLAQSKSQRGVAAIYANKFVGRKTASGERLDREHLTAAHRQYPFGTRLEVTNRNNGRSATVTINDRGPHSRRFALDFSPAAAKALGIHGTAPIEYHVVSAQ